MPMIPNRMRAASRPAVWLLTSLFLSTAAHAADPATGKLSIGAKTLIYVRVEFSDAPGEPVSKTEAEKAIADANQFFAQNSGGTFKLTPTITNVIRMPKYRSYYRDKESSVFIRDADDAARMSGLHPERYDFEVLASRSLGSRSSVQGIRGGKGVAVNGDFFWRPLTQELISNMGVSGSDLWQPKGANILGPGENVPYGDPWDFLGGQTSTPTASILSAAARYRLGWLNGPDSVTADKGGKFKIAPTTATDTPRSVRVPAANGTDYWLEYRPSKENDFANNGILVYRSKADGSAPQLLHMNPVEVKEHGASAAPLQTGYTFKDGDVFITPLKAGSKDMEVAVAIGPFPGNRQPKVDIGADKWEGVVGDELTMAALGEDEDGDTLAYRWDFGDGQTALNQQKISHAWKAPGTFTVTVYVTDTRGGESQHTGEFTITGAAEPVPGDPNATEPVAPGLAPP